MHGLNALNEYENTSGHGNDFYEKKERKALKKGMQTP